MISPLCVLSQWRENAAGEAERLFAGLRTERVCWSSSLGDITNLPPPHPTTYPDYLSQALLQGLLGQIT